MQSVVSSQSRARRIQGEGDCLEEFLGIVGLFEERNGAAFECGFLQAFETAGGDEDDRDVRQAQFMEALSDGEAEADRHPDVEEEQIGTIVDGKLETGVDYTRTERFTVHKEVKPKMVGLTLAGPGSSNTPIALGEW